MKLSDALRVQPGESIAFSGSGGKTTALITLARDLKEPIIATTTTHFGKEQIGFADHITYSPASSVGGAASSGFGSIPNMDFIFNMSVSRILSVVAIVSMALERPCPIDSPAILK